MFFVVGLIGIILPVIPSLPLMWAGVFVYGFFTDFQDVDGQVVLWTGVIALVGTIVDFVAGVLGAKATGASWLGIIGAIVGGIIGMGIFSIVGLFVGSALGTFAGEYLKHNDRQSAMRAMWGNLLGFVLGTLVKIGAAVGIIFLFIRAVL